MKLLENYPKIEIATRRYPSVNNTYQALISIYNGARRRSGRLVIDHCLGTAERVTHYVTDPVYINAALLHDAIEDGFLNFEDVKSISGLGIMGEVCARVVTVLSKASDIEDKKVRDGIYMKQLWKTAVGTRERNIATIKLADRINNMSDLEFLAPDRILFIIKQSLFYYFQMAMRLNLLTLGNRLLRSTMHYLNYPEIRDGGFKS